MRVLIVASYNKNCFAPFILEQAQALRQHGVVVDYFGVVGKGIKGYLKALSFLRKRIKEFQPDIVHAHGGLCGFVATLQSLCPVVTTYHGSDINNLWTRYISYMAILHSKCNVFVSQRLKSRVGWLRKKYAIVPCGVDTSIFYPIDKNDARKKLGWDMNKIYVLFSKQFDVKVKNYPLAKAAVELLPNAELVELKGYTREQVAILMNACDVALMTSFSEGSPQFIKEAVACSCPVVTTDVGDVREVLKGVSNSCICEYDPKDVVEKINKVLKIDREQISHLNEKYNNVSVAKQLFAIYSNLINQ